MENMGASIFRPALQRDLLASVFLRIAVNAMASSNPVRVDAICELDLNLPPR